MLRQTFWMVALLTEAPLQMPGQGTFQNLDFELANPTNICTTASVYLPTTNNLAGITESGRAARSSPGVLSYYFTNWPSWANGATVLHIGSGGYSFVVTNANF